jgi:hypothetical protein
MEAKAGVELIRREKDSWLGMIGKHVATLYENTVARVTKES